MVACLDKDEVECCDDDFLTCLDNVLVLCLDNNNKDYFYVGFLLSYPL